MLPMFFHAACFFGEGFKVQSRWFWPKTDWDLLLPRAWINCLSELGIPTGKIQSCMSWNDFHGAIHSWQWLGRQHFLSEWMVTNMNQAKLCSVERHTKCRHIPIKGSQWRVTHQWRRSSRQACTCHVRLVHPISPKHWPIQIHCTMLLKRICEKFSSQTHNILQASSTHTVWIVLNTDLSDKLELLWELYCFQELESDVTSSKNSSLQIKCSSKKVK